MRLGPEQEPVVATAGTLVLIPPGVVHSFDNDGAGGGPLPQLPRAGRRASRTTCAPAEDFDQFDPPADGGRPASDAIVTPAGGGERFRREDRAITVLGDLPEISALLIEVDPEWPGIGAHDHDDQVDTFFVLDGETGFLSGDDVVRAGAGDVLRRGAGCAPRRRPRGRPRGRSSTSTGRTQGSRRWVRSQ